MRYAAHLPGVEINSSFHRPHRRATYERWAASTPDAFRMALKIPKSITHEQRLVGCGALLDRFIEEAGGLGAKLGVVLVQLPPSLAFAAESVATFFADLTARTDAALACEPRHPSWFTAAADQLLRQHRVARVAADPAPVPEAAEPAGWAGLVYFRLHGSPVIYRSNYDEAALAAIETRIKRCTAAGADVWCIFDNTTLGCALGNALAVASEITRWRRSRADG